MAERNDITGHGEKFDFDRVLAEAPGAGDTMRGTEVAVAAGDLIHRARNRKAMSQANLAKRVGSTQPHISDIERGLGENGPTVGTIARLLRELDDELLVQSRKDRALWMADRIDAAEVALGDLTERIARSGVTNMTEVMAELSKANKAERENPFKNTLINGIVLGIHMALRAQPEAMVGAGQRAAARRIVEDMFDTSFSTLFPRGSSRN
jgi:transcriptional regulator with XRE-family HTH domain